MIGTSIRRDSLSIFSFFSDLRKELPSLLDSAQQLYSNLHINSDASFNPAGAYVQSAAETVRALFVGKVERDGAAAANAYRRWSGVSDNRVLSTAAGVLGVNVSILDSFLMEPTTNLVQGLVYGTTGMLDERAPALNRWESGAAALGAVSSLLMGAAGVMAERAAVQPQAIWVKAEVVPSTGKVFDVSLNPATGSYQLQASTSQGVRGLLPESPGSALVRSSSSPAPRPLVVLSRAQLDFARGGVGRHPPEIGGGGIFLAPEGKGTGVGAAPAPTSSSALSLKIIKELNAVLRRQALVASGALGETYQALVPDLIQVLNNNKKSLAHRSAAAEALGYIKPPSATPDLIKVLNNPNEPPELRLVTANALSCFRDQAVVPDLIQVLNNPNEPPELRLVTVIALGDIGDPRATPDLIQVLNNLNEPLELRSAAAEALGNIEDPRAIPDLIEVLNNKNEPSELRSAAAKALIYFRDQAVVPALIEVLKNIKEPQELRSAAAFGLVNIKDPQAVPALIEVLNNKNEPPKLRSAAAFGLGIIRDPQVFAALIEVLNNKNEPPELRSAAAEALGSIANPRATSDLIEVLKNIKEPPELRSAAAEALGELGDSRAIDPLMLALTDPNTDVQESAGIALEVIVKQNWIDLLIQNLQNDDPTVRVAAIIALGSFSNHYGVLRALLSLSKDPVHYVREVVGRVIANYEID